MINEVNSWRAEQPPHDLALRHQEMGGWEIEMLPYTLYFQIKIDNVKRNLVCLDLVSTFYFDYFYFVEKQYSTIVIFE